jgi:uncharacterized protein
MPVRSGTASLPLHGGRVPEWLAGRMAVLGAAIAESVILFEGRDGFLKRLSDPFWFQAFGAVMGMDWHSSGITTSVMGALKRGLSSKSGELGLHVLGGRGRHSRKTPDELRSLADRTGLDGDSLIRASRLTAKVDNTAVQDGFSLYLHSFVVTDDGRWVVVQQGMNGEAGTARRYHWRSDTVSSFVEAPHEAVVGKNQGVIINLTDKRAALARETAVFLANRGPDKTISGFLSATRRHLTMPAHHEVRPSDVFLRRLHAVIGAAADRGIGDFEELLLQQGLGPRTLQALALTAEVVFGAPSRFDDPARFSFAHGGKDGHPCPVPLKVYDKSIETLRHAVERAKLGESDKIDAFRRLDRRVRAMEQFARGPSFNRIIEEERRKSPFFGGMTVMGPAVEKKKKQPKKTPAPPKDRQLKLFV